MSHLGIKKRQGIPIVREGVEALEHKQETPPRKYTEGRITVSLCSIDIFDFSLTQNQLNAFF